MVTLYNLYVNQPGPVPGMVATTAPPDADRCLVPVMSLKQRFVPLISADGRHNSLLNDDGRDNSPLSVSDPSHRSLPWPRHGSA